MRTVLFAESIMLVCWWRGSRRNESRGSTPAAPPSQALPTHIASHWIDRGTLIATHTNQQALEAA